MTDLTTKFAIPKLTEKNYTHWSLMVETAAHSMMGYTILTSNVKKPDVPSDKGRADAIENYKIFYALQTLLLTSISESCLYIIRTHSTTPYDIWTTLREHFMPTMNRNVIRLRGNFYRMSLQSYGSMAKYIDAINTQAALINQLLEDISKKNGSSSSSSLPIISDMEKLTVLLMGLADDFETTREILETDPTMTYEKACIRLKEKAESSTILNSSASSSSSSGGYSRSEHANLANSSKGHGKSGQCVHCGKLHKSEKCWKKFPHLRPDFSQRAGSSSQHPGAPNGHSHISQSHSVSSENNFGHLENPQLCLPPKLANSNSRHGVPQQPKKGANVVEDEIWMLEEVIGTNIEALHAGSEEEVLSLIIDSGASSHILGADFYPHLTNWREGPIHRIHVADSRVCESKFIADLPFIVTSSDGPKNVVLKDVIYMGNFPRGLVSVSKLAEKGVQTSFHANGCTIKTSSFSVEISKNQHNDLYFLHTSLLHCPNASQIDHHANLDEVPDLHDADVTPDAMSQSQQKLFDLHSSLGHCSMKTLRMAVSKGHITGITLQDLKRSLESCEVCKTAKLRAHTTKHSQTVFPATQPFERVHGDYGGKYRDTWNGKCGFSIFIDDHTSWISGKLIERKNEVCDHFKEFFNQVKSFGYTIQAIHTDSAKEYIEKQSFIDWLSQHHVSRSASSPHSQYQNGLAEVTMQQVQNHIRCALYQSGLPHSYWGEAFLHTIFTWNRTPKVTNGGLTPYEFVTERVPNVKFMHPFGCQASAIHHNDDLPKFSSRGRPCVLIGYDSIRKGYRLLTLDDLSILVRAPRDVTFEDHKFPIRELKMDATLRSLFNNIEKDKELRPQEDYVDFYVHHSPTDNGGGVQVTNLPLTPQSTPPMLLLDATAPSTPASTPPLFLPPIPQTPQVIQDAPSTPTHSHSPMILDQVHFEGGMMEIQNTPPYDPGPLTLQRVYGTTPTFFQHIQANLPRLRSQVPDPLHSAIASCDDITNLDLVTHEFIDHSALISEIHSTEMVTPKSHAQAISLPEAKQWQEAMEKEMKAIHDAGTYDLVPVNDVPIQAKVATPIWSFRIKFDGTFKARLCFPGHHQQYGIDYFDTESPVAKFSTFRMFMVIITQKKEKAHHFDIPNAFLNGEIHENVYMRQPPGFIDQRFPTHVCRLKKALYGLKQASLAWYIKLDDVLTSIGLEKHSADPCLYFTFKNDQWAMVLVYVDDNAIAGTPKLREKIIDTLQSAFRAKDLGIASRYIGISIEYDEKGIFLHQTRDIEDFLKKQKFFNASPLKTPFNEYSHAEIVESEPFDQTIFRSAIGSLMWYALSTRPDILFVVTSMAQFQAKPTKKAFDCVTRIFRYLKGTTGHGIFIPYAHGNEAKNFILTPYADASFAIPILGSKSASGVMVMLNGVPIHWISRKQRLVSLSSTESEIIASSLCAQEVLWLMQVLAPLVSIDLPVKMCIDNLSMKYIAESKLTSHRTKHLDLRYLFVKQLLTEHPVILQWVSSEENIADLLTKYFTTVSTFKNLVKMVTADRIH